MMLIREFYMKECINSNWNVRELQMIIKANEYERLPKDTKNKLIKKRNTKCSRFCKKTYSN